MNDATKRKTPLTARLAAVRLFLLLVVALCLPETRVWSFGINSPPAPGEIAFANPSSTGENYDCIAYDAPDSSVAAKTPLQLKAPVTAREARDIAVNPNAPRLLPWQNRKVGGTPAQQQALAADIQEALAQRATDIWVNQQQVNALGQRVGVNRPDLQYTLPDGRRIYIEYDNMTPGTWPNTPRGPGHGDRILANDPEGIFVPKTY